MKNKIVLFLAVVFMSANFTPVSADPPHSPQGADAVPDLYAPNLAGPGGFGTTSGGAPASALNPAQGGSSLRIAFDAGYLAIPAFSNAGRQDGGYMQSIEAGAMFPTKYGVFGGSARYIGGFAADQFEKDYFAVNPTFGGNFFAAKEVYPGMSVGAGLNYGFGSDWTLSGDLGFHYATGKNLGPFKNFTWAAVLHSLGKSYFPAWLTATGGISFDLLRIEGQDGKADPFAVNFSADMGLPSLFYPPYINFIFKTGLKMTIADIVNLSFSWPGGSGFNAREIAEKNVGFPAIPSIGLGVNIILPSGGERIAGGRLPSDGDLKIDGAYKPLYEGIAAIGGGVTWLVGVADKKPPVIKTEYPEPADTSYPVYFSPNNDGKADYLEFPWAITDDHYVTGWKVEIKDAEGNIVRTIQNKEQRPISFTVKEFFNRLFAVKKQVEVPPVFTWDGIRDEGGVAPDGKYYFTITSTDDSGNTAVSPAHEVVLKNTPPEVNIAAMSGTQLIFNPMGGDKSSIAFSPYGSEEDAWESEIWNAAGQKIRSFKNVSGQPTPQVWDGKTDAGQVAPDGVYSYRISATDRAMNSASAAVNNIILSGQVAGVIMTSSAEYIAPKAGQEANLVDFTVHLSFQEGIESWKLELKDGSGTAQKTFFGGGRVPANVRWNGLDDNGAIKEGVFTPEFTVRYTRGDEAKTSATRVTVDVSGPKLALAYTPEYFSPDNDGVEDELFISLSADDVSPIAGWKLEIRDPESGAAFYNVEGKGSPTSRLIWNGRSNKGELVQSATDYPYTFTAEDILGNISSTNGKIGVDVLVIRDGDKLRIMIPSIVFRPNFADFEGLSGDIIDNNTRILRRIAQTLNKFRDYKVQVEGHANPTTAPGAARDREEIELQRISEARARKVVDELVRYGVARNRLSSIGVGGTRTVVPWDDMDNRWKNRRVEFILIK
jgi:outer membrane protein OmpA-like peptidoglycan-associated protein/flagellar hook assembly protein FlgD